MDEKMRRLYEAYPALWDMWLEARDDPPPDEPPPEEPSGGDSESEPSDGELPQLVGDDEVEDVFAALEAKRAEWEAMTRMATRPSRWSSGAGRVSRRRQATPRTAFR